MRLWMTRHIFNILLFCTIYTKKENMRRLIILNCATGPNKVIWKGCDKTWMLLCLQVGVMYCRSGQATEEEMYNNEEAGPAFHEFLETIGQRVRLNSFDKYKAGLDNKSKCHNFFKIALQIYFLRW